VKDYEYSANNPLEFYERAIELAELIHYQTIKKILREYAPSGQELLQR